MPDDQPDSPKATFWTTAVVSFVVLSFSLSILADWLDERLFGGGKWLRSKTPALSFPLMIVAYAIATRVCRAAGVSLESNAVEVIRRGVEVPGVEPPRPFDLKWPEKAWLMLAGIVAVCGLVTLAVMLSGGSVPGEEIYGYLLAGGLAVVAFCCWLAYRYKLGLVARVNAEGVRSYHRGRSLTRLVPWPDIETCEVTVRRTPLGDWYRPRFVFKDQAGKVLLDMQTIGAEPPQMLLFQEAITCYLNAAPAAAQITTHE